MERGGNRTLPNLPPYTPAALPLSYRSTRNEIGCDPAPLPRPGINVLRMEPHPTDGSGYLPRPPF